MAEEISSTDSPMTIFAGNIVSSHSNPLVAINASQIPFKLVKGNYVAWRAQFTNLLFGFDKLGFIDGTSSCPSQMSTEGTKTIPNPEYKLWKRQDSFILHALIGSVHTSLSSLITSAETSFEAWNKLEKTFVNKSRTRMLSLRDSLMKISQDSLSISDYMQAIKKIADDLALIGYPSNDDELIVNVLNGLGNNYKEICAAIRARDTTVTFEELHEILLGHETFLKRDEPLKDTPSITAHYNQRTNNNKGKHGNNNRGPNSGGSKPRSQRQQGNWANHWTSSTQGYVIELDFQLG